MPGGEEGEEVKRGSRRGGGGGGRPSEREEGKGRGREVLKVAFVTKRVSSFIVHRRRASTIGCASFKYSRSLKTAVRRPRAGIVQEQVRNWSLKSRLRKKLAIDV